MAKASIPVYDICTIDQRAQKDLLIERFASYLEKHYSHLHQPHRHSFYHLVLFTKGKGSHTIDFETFSVKPYQIYFMAPGQVHSWNFDNQPDGFIVNFSERIPNALVANPIYPGQFSFFSGIADQQVISIPADERSKIEQTLEVIVDEGNSQNAFKDDFARTALIQ